MFTSEIQAMSGCELCHAWSCKVSNVATGSVNKVTCTHEHKHEQPKKVTISGTKDVKF